jgi:hypothetical protein
MNARGRQAYLSQRDGFFRNKATAAAFVVSDRAGCFMKFTIEVLLSRGVEREQVLYRASVDEISPKRAKTRADQLLRIWRGRGASRARVLNHQGEEIYSC